MKWLLLVKGPRASASVELLLFGLTAQIHCVASP